MGKETDERGKKEKSGEVKRLERSRNDGNDNGDGGGEQRGRRKAHVRRKGERAGEPLFS